MANFNNIYKQTTIKGDDLTELRRSISRMNLHLSIADGVNIRPGKDIDTDLIKLHVTGKPTFWWDESENHFVLDEGLEVIQDNIDEPLLWFKGAAASGVLTKTIVDEDDVTTATRKGWVKIDMANTGDGIASGEYFVPFYSVV